VCTPGRRSVLEEWALIAIQRANSDRPSALGSDKYGDEDPGATATHIYKDRCKYKDWGEIGPD